MANEVSMIEMFQAGVHFGHHTRYWNPKMKPFLFGSRNKIHIINLEHTLIAFNQAMEWMKGQAALGNPILFVGTKRAARKTLQSEAERVGMPYVCNRWLGGMLTNYKTVRASILRLKALEEEKNSGAFEKLPKKEAIMKTRELYKLERALGGVKDLSGLPSALFVVDVDYERIAVQEASKLKIPIIGVVDSNSDPSNIDFVIPGNDDSQRAVSLYINSAANACEEGLRERRAGSGNDDFVEVVNAPSIEVSNSRHTSTTPVEQAQDEPESADVQGQENVAQQQPEQKEEPVEKLEAAKSADEA